MSLEADLEILRRSQAAGVDLAAEVRALAQRVERAEARPKDRPTAELCYACHGEPYSERGECERCDPMGPPYGFRWSPPDSWLVGDQKRIDETARATYCAWSAAIAAVGCPLPEAGDYDGHAAPVAWIRDVLSAPPELFERADWARLDDKDAWR